MEVRVKDEQNDQVQNDVSGAMSNFDYNKLYGDLCRRLLNTPVGEIFPNTVSGESIARNPVNQETEMPRVTLPQKSSPRCTSPSNVHSPFPVYGTIPIQSASCHGNLYKSDINVLQYHNIKQGQAKCEHTNGNSMTDFSMTIENVNSQAEDNVDEMLTSLCPIGGLHDFIDVQKLVDEFRITLEKFGVSQRFAARFIMQDTSQGNLSFLMDKGRNKRWEELSPRGRQPYLKMKAWLESKELQMQTLDMLKYSQDMRRSCPRESYNRRERFSMFQLNVLCRLFEENPNPPMDTRNAVADRLNIPLDRVNVWFQNQRARGFPARKILQQPMYEEAAECLQESVKDDLPDSKVSAKLYQHSQEANEPLSFLANNQAQNDKHAPTGIPVPSTSKPHDFVKTDKTYFSLQSPVSEKDDVPLDLSSSRTSNLISPCSVLTVVPHVPKQSLLTAEYQQKYDRRDANAFEKETFTAMGKVHQSGAAKRKRGFKPQHRSQTKIARSATKISVSCHCLNESELCERNCTSLGIDNMHKTSCKHFIMTEPYSEQDLMQSLHDDTFYHREDAVNAQNTYNYFIKDDCKESQSTSNSVIENNFCKQEEDVKEFRKSIDLKDTVTNVNTELKYNIKGTEKSENGKESMDSASVEKSKMFKLEQFLSKLQYQKCSNDSNPQTANEKLQNSDDTVEKINPEALNMFKAFYVSIASSKNKTHCLKEPDLD